MTSTSADDDTGAVAEQSAAAPSSRAGDLSGTSETLIAEKGDFEGEWKFRQRLSVNPEPFLENARLHRELDEHHRDRRSELRRYARLDMVTVARLKAEHGIDVFNLRGNDGKRLMKIIDRDFPLLKTTTMSSTRRAR